MQMTTGMVKNTITRTVPRVKVVDYSSDSLGRQVEGTGEEYCNWQQVLLQFSSVIPVVLVI